MSKKIVIIGGVAGGMSAATRLRRLMEDAEIHVIEKGSYVSFANCGLPYYISGVISDEEKLVVQTPEKLYDRFRLNIHTNTEAIAIHPQQKTITIKHYEEISELSYDELIVSPGASPIIPDIEGMDDVKNVFTIRNIPDIQRVKEYIQKHNIKSATVVGAGFIGLEMIENIKHLEIDVNLVELSSQVLSPLDEEMAQYVEKELIKNNVHIYKGVSVNKFMNQGSELQLSDGKNITSDLTILSIGVQPQSQLLEKIDAKLGMRKGIVVDNNYCTSIPHIYAIGDAAITKQQINNQDSLIPLASPANRQGRQVADTIAGKKENANQGSIGTAIVKVFDLVAASTGLNEKQLKQQNMNYQSIHVIGSQHASYYPNATDIYLKVLFEKDSGKLLGAQAVGKEGVDKRIDVLATAIKGHLKIQELQELELTYAPPFGSAKDVVNIAGYIGENMINGITDTIQWNELEQYIHKKNYKLIDVRETSELKNNGEYPYPYIHIPLHELRERLSTLSPEQNYIIACQAGLRGYIGERILKQNQYHVKNLDGGYRILMGR